jgi:hypothetical protein
MFKRVKPASLPAAVVSITSAEVGLSFDQAKRAKRYFISMMLLPSPYRWFALFGAVVLPYVAVIVANAGREGSAIGSAVMNESKKSIN